MPLCIHVSVSAASDSNVFLPPMLFPNSTLLCDWLQALQDALCDQLAALLLPPAASAQHSTAWAAPGEANSTPLAWARMGSHGAFTTPPVRQEAGARVRQWGQASLAHLLLPCGPMWPHAANPHPGRGSKLGAASRVQAVVQLLTMLQMLQELQPPCGPMQHPRGPMPPCGADQQGGATLGLTESHQAVAGLLLAATHVPPNPMLAFPKITAPTTAFTTAPTTAPTTAQLWASSGHQQPQQAGRDAAGVRGCTGAEEALLWDLSLAKAQSHLQSELLKVGVGLEADSSLDRNGYNNGSSRGTLARSAHLYYLMHSCYLMWP